MKALCVTVDAPLLGRREKDMRNKFTLQGSDVQKAADAQGAVQRDGGAARAISQFIDPSLSWADLAWLRAATTLPLVLKGVQCAEDAVLAAQHGVAAIILSNHGGRQLDGARSGIEVLAEVRPALRAAGPAAARMEVYVDGGVRRGTDVVKALALGATAVGIGRPVLYGLAAFGEPGVDRVLDILREETATAMRLVGARALRDLTPALVVASSLGDHGASVPTDHLAQRTYEPLAPASLPQ